MKIASETRSYRAAGGGRTGGCEYYYNARWYDPDLGRFISEDPIMDGPNWYAYVANSPLISVDHDGLVISYEPSGERSNYDSETGVTTYVADPYMSAEEAGRLNAEIIVGAGQYRDRSIPAFLPSVVDPQALKIAEIAQRIALLNPGDDTCTPVLITIGKEFGRDMSPFAGMNADKIHAKLEEMSKDPSSDVTKVSAYMSQAASNIGEFVIGARGKWPDPDDADIEHAGHVNVVVYDLSRINITDRGTGTDSPRVIGGGITTEQRVQWGRKVEDASWQFSFGKTNERPDYYIYKKMQR